MLAALESRFQKIEADRRRMIAAVQSLPPEKQNQSADGKEMSPAAVLLHFVRIEQWHLDFLRKNPPATLAGRATKRGFVFSNGVLEMRNTSKVAPTLPKFLPKGPVDVAATVAAFDQGRAEIADFLGQATDADAAFIKMIFFFGTLSANDYLTMLDLHQGYHLARLPQGGG